MLEDHYSNTCAAILYWLVYMQVSLTKDIARALLPGKINVKVTTVRNWYQSVVK